MDITIFDFKFSSFIYAFKKTYILDDGTYDYMSFLQYTDWASYGGMLQTYKDPNGVLNDLLTSSLKSITVVGNKQMKGGDFPGSISHLILFVMFLLTITQALAGPSVDALHASYSVTGIPHDPKVVAEPQDLWSSFIGKFGVSSTAKLEFSKYLAEKERYEKYVPRLTTALEEDKLTATYESINQARQTTAENERVKAENDRLRIQNDHKDRTANTELFFHLLKKTDKQFDELLKAKDELLKATKETADLKQMLTVAGMISFGFILQFVNSRFKFINDGRDTNQRLGNGNGDPSLGIGNGDNNDSIPRFSVPPLRLGNGIQRTGNLDNGHRSGSGPGRRKTNRRTKKNRKSKKYRK